MMAEYEDFSGELDPSSFLPCGLCGRTFLPESLSRHEKICAKSGKTRKVFQSGKQRAAGSDVPVTAVLKSGAPPPKKVVRPEQPKGKANNWRAKHEDFVNTIRAARGVSKALAEGGPLPPPPPPTINPDYVQCPTCSRRFNETAAERHMKFCAEQSKRIPDKKFVNPEAQRRKEARSNYKTAKPRLKVKEGTMYNPSNYQSNHLSERGGSAEAERYSQNRREGSYSAGSLGSPNGGPPLRTGKTEDNYHAGLQIRNSSLNTVQKKNAKTLAQAMGNGTAGQNYNHAENYYSPSPPGAGRPPSGSYQHRVRENSGDARKRNPHLDRAPNRVPSASKFCYDCGNKFCRAEAKYCCECGQQRVIL